MNCPTLPIEKAYYSPPQNSTLTLIYLLRFAVCIAGLEILAKSAKPDNVWVTMLSEIKQPAGVRVYSVVREQGSPLTNSLVYYSMALNQTYEQICKTGLVLLNFHVLVVI